MRRLAVQIARLTGDAWRATRDGGLSAYDRVVEFATSTALQSRGGNNSAAAAEKLAESRVATVPDGVRVYAVGDVHGRADLLKRLMEKIRADAADLAPGEEARLIFLGDYVDRGFQSKEVIDLLLSDAMDGFTPVFLKGNHESAFLEFLGDASFGPEWAKFGGAETLTSYGIRPPRSKTFAEEWTDVRDQLNEVLPLEHRNFLVSLEIAASVGDYVFVHAGLRPGKPIEEQVEQDILWIRDTFLNDKSAFDQVVVHGHTPITAPYRDHRRIGVDTGAYLSGTLTAARLSGADVSFIST